MGVVSLVKVFCSTRASEREKIGEKVTKWLDANPAVQVVKTVVAQSSDAAFHCLSIVLFCRMLS
jgi:hypothetical protein